MLSGGRSVALALALACALGGTAAACGTDSADAPAPVPALPDAGAAADGEPTASVPLCVDGKPTAAYPPGPYEMGITAPLPPGLEFAGPAGAVRLKDYFEPCAARSRLLVVRTSAAWCGPCVWHATNTKRLFGDPRTEGRLLLVDLLLADEDNMPATTEAAERWRARIDAPSSLSPRIGIDANYTFAPLVIGKAPLPEYVVIDTRSMQVLTALSSPDPETLAAFFAIELAALDGKPRIDLPERTLHDELLSLDQWELLQGMQPPAAPPPDPTNEVADSAGAAALGKALFEDVSLSPSGTVACSTCHDRSKAFGDGLKQATGAALGDRNSPPIALAAHARWQFWDGRADTLWMQALGPFEDVKEVASSRLFVAHAIVDRYAAAYGALFGAKYPLPDLAGLPASGRPGDPAYDALPPATRDGITRVFVNAGKVIAAFERTLRVKPNALDRYAAGDNAALAPAQKSALKTFFVAGCPQCHWGPRLTNDAFHALRFPTGRQDGTGDRGRAEVLLGLGAAEFTGKSKWSDAPAAARLLSFTAVPTSMVGAFKTPTLRGIAKSAPFGHGGTLATLNDVAKHYGERAKEVPLARSAGAVEEWVPAFDATAQASLPTILEVMTADVEP